MLCNKNKFAWHYEIARPLMQSSQINESMLMNSLKIEQWLQEMTISVHFLVEFINTLYDLLIP
ncbi:hypothetical protein [Legionella feeleii]|nr:hypothetical protein [Legionella feeleii]